MKKEKPLEIVFHNPNSSEETISELIKLLAELSKTKITKLLLLRSEQPREFLESKLEG